MSSVVTIAIGVVFVFLVFSLVISGVNEALVAVTSLRAKVLWATFRHFADAEAGPGGRASRLTLKGMFRLLLGGWDPRPNGADVAEVNDGTQKFLNSIRKQTERFESGNRKSRLKKVSPVVVSRAVLELGGDLTAFAQSDKVAIGQFFGRITEAVHGTQIERPVKLAIAEAQGDIEKFRASIETWFDARMEALSSLYKVWSRWILLVLAFILAFAVDVNPIVAVDLLRKDDALAAATVEQAAAFAKDQTLPLSNCPSSATTTTTTVAGAATEPATDTLEACYQSVRDAVARTRTLPPPMNFDHFGRGTEEYWQYILGCLLGAIAISFGAPFWYDVLRRLIATRT